jgi:glucoamylase
MWRSTASSRWRSGLGDGHHAALSGDDAGADYAVREALRAVYRAVDAGEDAGGAGGGVDGRRRLSRISHNVVLTHEDKTYSGAFIASASIPWGASKGDDDLGGYHLVWTRDMVQSATALLACGRSETALRALVYLACTQHPDGSFAQNFWIDGTPYWTGIQLDEVAFPDHAGVAAVEGEWLGKFDVFPFVERAAGFLVRYAPITQQERWEENCGLLAVDAGGGDCGLVCAADLARAHHQAPELAGFWRTTRTGSRRIWTSGRRPTMGAAAGGEAALHADPAAGEGEPFHNPEDSGGAYAGAGEPRAGREGGV